MAKTIEELNVIKEEVETMNKKLSELSDEELNIVTGGEGNIWIKEESYDVFGTNNQGGSIQEIIGDWNIEDHSN